MAAMSIAAYFAFFHGNANDPIPGWNARMRGCPYSPEEVSNALWAFMDEWGKRFGQAEADALRALFNNVGFLGLGRFRIYFQRVRGERHYTLNWGGTQMKVAGHMINQSAIAIAVLPDDPLGATAFFHELTHPSLLKLKNNEDSNHATYPGPWAGEHDNMINHLRDCFKNVFPVDGFDPGIGRKNAPTQAASNQGGVAIVPTFCGTCVVASWRKTTSATKRSLP